MALPPTDALAADDEISDRDLLAATLAFNTRVFGAILGALAGMALLALGLVGYYGHGLVRLAVALIGVFLPGYASTWPGAFIGAFWGVVLGVLLGAGIYRLNARQVLGKVDILVMREGGRAELPRAVLRLDGAALAVAIGSIGALGLVTTTNMLVARGTAAESVHARLLSELLPGYAVTPAGSIVGAIELFAVLWICARGFAAVYNAVAARRHRR
jgi:hypothetical protein